MGWMLMIIGILLLICFSVEGTFFCFVLLDESGSIGTWGATGICMVITCIVVCYLRVKELWKASYILSVIGMMGIIQLIILGTIETPYIWKDDGAFIRFFAAFGFQTVICLVSYMIASFPVNSYDEKVRTILSQIKNNLNLQIKGLNIMENKLSEINDKHRVVDEAVILLETISNSAINTRYIQIRYERNRMILNCLSELNEKYKLNLQIEDKTILEISAQLKKIINNKERQLSNINNNVYTRKNLRELKQILSEI